MSDGVTAIWNKFKHDHPEDFVNGQLKVSVGGGAGK
jgi:hypothetical protein